MNSLDLTTFSVTAAGVIVVPGIPEPKTRADVFEQVDLRGIHGREELILLIEKCQPLASHFRFLSMVYLDEHSQADGFVDNLVAQRGPRSGAQQLILRVLRRDPDGGWREWIRCSGDSALEGFLQRVRDWLADDIDWSESEYFDAVWNGQEAAFAHFDDLPAPILKTIGVRIVDGDVPGSTYRAAELRKGIDAANQAAELLELDFRFESAAAPVVQVCHD